VPAAARSLPAALALGAALAGAATQARPSRAAESWPSPEILRAIAAAAPRSVAGGIDCQDVDHDCPATRRVARAVRSAAETLAGCARRGTEPCDLSAALARVPEPECAGAIECQVRSLMALVDGGRPRCRRRLFMRGARLMVKKVVRIRRDREADIPGDVARCARHPRRRCDDAVSVLLRLGCAHRPAVECLCAAADTLSNRLLLRPATCAAQRTTPCAVRKVRGPRPNFVIILADDQRWDTVGATHESPNRPGPVMPIVTRELAQSGVTFTNSYVTTSLCCPSRTSTLTGRFAHGTGVRFNAPPAGGAQKFDDTCTLATWLKAAGYRTGFVGKYLNGYETLAPCIPPGWDEWHVPVVPSYYDYDLNDDGVLTRFGHDASDYTGDVMTQRAVDFIHASAGKRFFLHLSQRAPHDPAIPALRHVGLFAGLAPFRPASYAEPDASDKPAWVQTLDWDDATRDRVDRFRIAQLESLQAVDESVGAVMQALRDIGADDDTLVVYTSDNGFAWGEHRWLTKLCPYEECIRVPLVVRYPPLVRGAPRLDDHFVLNIDLAPTFAALAGVVPPRPMNGASLVPLLAGAAPGWRTDFLAEHWFGRPPDNGLVEGSVDGRRWKYVEYVNGETELYDLETDPSELSNVTGDPRHAEVKATLAARLRQLQAE
jgi:N-acetylglucosamine-6-sulfatase